MKLLKFFKEVADRVLKNDLIAMANELTFKLMLSVFPFLIFFLTVIAHLKIEYSEYIDYVLSDIPADAAAIITAFLEETVYSRHAGLMSVSLIVALYSASSGFHSLIKGINRAYGVREKRNFFFTRLISLFLMLIFMLTLTVSIYILILRSQINHALVQLHILKELPKDTSFVVKVLMALVITVVICLVYQIGANVSVRLINTMPGTLFTVGGWFGLSKLFNIYINRYAAYSAVYGSIGALFVSALWLNLLCIVLLVGCQINAVLEDTARLDELLKIHKQPEEPKDENDAQIRIKHLDDLGLERDDRSRRLIHSKEFNDRKNSEKRLNGRKRRKPVKQDSQQA